MDARVMQEIDGRSSSCVNVSAWITYNPTPTVPGDA